MDIATLVGLIGFVAALLAVATGDLGMLLEGPLLAIVWGGGVAMTLIAMPLRQVLGLGPVLMRTLFTRDVSPTHTVKRSAQLAELAAAEGLLALEADVERHADDPFLRQGILLAVDGTEPDLVMDILETELQFIEQRHEQARRAIHVVGRCFLTMGLAVAPVALIAFTGRNTELLQAVHLSALPLLYGVAVWALAAPIANKLRGYSEAEVLQKRMVIEAVMAIQSGDHPRIVEHKLAVFLAPAHRPSGDHQSTTPEPVSLPDAAFVEEVKRRAAELGPAEFAFADITKLADREIQGLLREIDQSSLVAALVGATEPVREKLTRNMSDRVRIFILSQTGFVAETSAEEVAGIHAAICHQIVRLAKDGHISLP